MVETTLPNASTLDKVYPGWRKLVANASIKEFSEFKVNGALTTSFFGIQSHFGSDASLVPGLAGVILDSPYPNFARGMVEANEHIVYPGPDGCFGTIRKSSFVKNPARKTGLIPISVSGHTDLTTSPILLSDGLELVCCQRQSEPPFALTEADLSAAKAGDYKSINTKRGVVGKAANGSAIYARHQNVIGSLIGKLGYTLDSSLPMILVQDNFNGQTADNASVDGSGLLTQWDNKSGCAAPGLDLPGRKLIWMFYYNHMTGGLKTNSGTAVGFYVMDDGSTQSVSIINNRARYQGANCYLVYYDDHRYFEPGTRSGYGSSSKGSLLAQVFGFALTLDGIEYKLGELKDGMGTTGPTIDSVNGSSRLAKINFIPLLGLPGKINYSFMGNVNLVSSSSVLVDDIEVQFHSYDVDADLFIASLDFSWYESYYSTGFDVYTPRASNIQGNTLESWKEIQQYQIKLVHAKQSYLLTEQMVRDLPSHREYARARKKACKDNDFMKLSYDGVNTYGSLVQRATARRTFMQMGADAGSSDFTMDIRSIVSVSVVGSSAVGVTAIGEEIALTVETYGEYLATGGSRNTSVETVLGLSTTDAQLLASVDTKVPNMSETMFSFFGDGSKDYTTNRLAQSINGYPLYPLLNRTQRTYLQLSNISQFDSMSLPLMRVIQSLSADKMWVRFK